jgi:hypothetical protein
VSTAGAMSLNPLIGEPTVGIAGVNTGPLLGDLDVRLKLRRRLALPQLWLVASEEPRTDGTGVAGRAALP